VKNFIYLLIWILLVLNTNCQQFGKESVNLTYGFTPGRKYVQNMQLTQKTVQATKGQAYEVLVDVKSSSLFTSENIEKDGTATVLFSVLDLSQHTVKPEEDTTRVYRDLTDITRIRYSKTGMILSAVRTDSSRAAFLIDQLSPGKLMILPGKQVRVGEKWLVTDTVPGNAFMGNPFAVDVIRQTEYKLAGTETKEGRKLIKVTHIKTFKINGKGFWMGMEISLEGTGQTRGYSFFDHKLSMMAYSEEETELIMNMAMADPYNLNSLITQTTKTIITFDVVN